MDLAKLYINGDKMKCIKIFELSETEVSCAGDVRSFVAARGSSFVGFLSKESCTYLGLSYSFFKLKLKEIRILFAQYA